MRQDFALFQRLLPRIGFASLALLAVLPAAVRAGDDKPDKRPNILLAVADDWSWPHAGVYGDKVVKTPIFDRVAAEGILFSHSFCAAPTCSASRAALLTGQASYRLEEGGNLWGILPKKFAVYPDLLEAAGYQVGFMGKGWGPGSLEGSGRKRNPVGPQFKNFAEFLKSVPSDRPFCFWFGSHDPHRPYDRDTGVKSGLKLEAVSVPAFLPDTPEVRGDILDYYFAVQRFDRDLGEVLDLLEKSGRAKNTLLVVTSDNGWPFPRAKANLYDAGCRMPLAIRWPGHVEAGRKSDAFVGHTDFAPTFLEAAGIKPPPEMTGRSLVGLLAGARTEKRDRVFLERERHANVRQGDVGYPCRAIRTPEYLYIRNYRPERWPADDPELWKAVGPFGDIDGGPSKELLLAKRDDPKIKKLFELACGKRPAEELYDLTRDPDQLVNVAGRADHKEAQQNLRDELDRRLKETGDPRSVKDDDPWDRYRYFGPSAKK
jgi:N-sulfoglucosamine sulfohydrolase